MAHTTRHQQRSYFAGLAARSVCVVLILALWAMPQLLNARSMGTLDEMAGRTSPVNEEEVKHADAQELFTDVLTTLAPQGLPGRAPHTEESPLLAAHGEVPDPPPW